jgi:hypothetical protein
MFNFSQTRRDGAGDPLPDAHETTPAHGEGGRPGWRRHVVAPLAAVRRLYVELRVAWREGARFPSDLPVRDYPIARRDGVR